MIKCIIFDCDGTLVDSEYLGHLGFEIAFREFGIESSATELMHQFRGSKLANILQAIEKEHQIELPATFVPRYRAVVDELFVQDLQPCEGVKDMLNDIGLPKCVASSAPMKKINRVLSITGLTSHFDPHIFSCYTIESWKPEPDIFLHAAEVMGFKPHECAVVEDSPPGIAAALAAGMLTVQYDPHAKSESNQDVIQIQHMRELKAALT